LTAQTSILLHVKTIANDNSHYNLSGADELGIICFILLGLLLPYFQVVTNID